MKSIVIVDALSTGINYLNDIIQRNYRPVVLEASWGDHPEESFMATRRYIRKRYAGKADFVEEQPTYEETLSAIKAYDPLFIIPGCESGVELATRLSDDLGLRGNPYSGLDKLVHKDAMHEALKNYGVRYIRGKIVHSVDEAVAYYREEKFLHGCVVKPSRGGGTVGVHLCDDEEEMVEALRAEFGSTNVFGNKCESLLLQERIVGTEYIVNTISVDGKHRLSSMWRYTKKRVLGGGNVYDAAEILGSLEAGHSRLVRYAMDVANAIGFQNGYIHGEYMIDEAGPVLIEVNCRVMGGNMTAAFLDPIFGHHETDNLLDSFLDPAWHEQMCEKPYRIYNRGYQKFFINPEDTTLDLAPVVSIVKHLRSFREGSISGVASGTLVRTVDMETSGGLLFLSHRDPYVLEKDVQFLRKIDQEYHDMLFVNHPVDPARRPEQLTSVTDLMKQCGCNRSILVLTNDDALDVHATVLHDSDSRNAIGSYNWVIWDADYRENEDIEQMTEDFYFLASKLQKGGHLLIPEKTYWHFPCGMESIEVLCESIGLIIEAPTTPAHQGVIIATMDD